MSVLSLSAHSRGLSWAGGVTALLVIFVGVGLSAVWWPLASLVLLMALWLGVRGRYFPGDILVVLIAGNIILGFGFANLGLRVGGLPLPLTEVLLLPLVGLAALRLRSLKELGWPGVFLVGFLVVSTLRLLASLHDWGPLALRDYTTALEALSLLVGFWAVREYGLGRWIQTWRVVLLFLLLYASLIPLQEGLASMGPVVGLQRPVPLLGQFSSAGIGISAALLFFYLFSERSRSYLLGVWCIVLLAVIQFRGLYFAVPLAILFSATASPRIAAVATFRFAVGLGIAALALILLSPLIPSGRVGPITPAFYTSHISTIIGVDGPAAGTIENRIKWAGDVWDKVSAKPANLVVGLGLGPDLIPSHRGLQGQLVRKPHNDYLEIFARTGIIGLLLWVGLLATPLARIWSVVRKKRVHGAEVTFLVWVLTLAAVYLFVSAFQPLMAFPYGTIPLFTSLGMALAVATRAAADSQHPLRSASGNL